MEGVKPEGAEAAARARREVCYWCREEGHHQADCTNPPFCFRCKESGHVAAKCPKSKGVSIHMYGFGFPGQGYHSLKILGVDKKQQKQENVGLIRVKSGVDTVERMEQELRHLIDEKWQWNVREVASKEYVVTFPNKQILDTFARSNGFELALYKISITISPTTIIPGVSSVLQEGWVQMFNVPDEAKGVEAVTAIA
jgi:hypothetical protein